MTPKKVNKLIAICGLCMFTFWGLGNFIDEAFYPFAFFSIVTVFPLLFMAKCPKCGGRLRPNSRRSSSSFQCKSCKETFR